MGFLAGKRALVPQRHKMPEHGQARSLRERGQRLHGDAFIHASRIIELLTRLQAPPPSLTTPFPLLV